ncbi:Acetoacetyl-CoA synthetase [Araneus ventricosus]|uniref:Acetoacetyl-CoA synthetase n=1 Tax=Araneus ventricosus TaxID=182803 RepID=A0A4Y2LSZ6_ARAVE|nr:Acetoacetyl-CoA synthetase [Araneus ventricosus]
MKIIQIICLTPDEMARVKSQMFITGFNRSYQCESTPDFLHEARLELQQNPKDIEFEQLPFDYPLCISFTSGTTGAPKALVHSTGMFFASLRDFGIHQNCTRKDRLFNRSPNGWITWNMNVNALHLGLSLVLYDGDPFQESPTRFWDLADKFGITSAYMWSSTIDFINVNGWGPTTEHSLKALRQIFLVGSPPKRSTYDFLTKTVKPGLFCNSGYGCTEVFGLINGVNSNMPVYRGEAQILSLGMDSRILDENGSPVIGKRGVMVLGNPYPTLPVCLLHDESKEKVRELYLSEYPGYITDTVQPSPIAAELTGKTPQLPIAHLPHDWSVGFQKVVSTD